MNKCQVEALVPYTYDNAHLGINFWQRNADLLSDIAYLSERRTYQSSTPQRQSYRYGSLNQETVSQAVNGHSQVALEPVGLVPRREQSILAMEEYSARIGDYIENCIRELCVDQRDCARDFERGVSIETYHRLCRLAMRRCEDVEFLKM